MINHRDSMDDSPKWYCLLPYRNSDSSVVLLLFDLRVLSPNISLRPGAGHWPSIDKRIPDRAYKSTFISSTP